MAIMEPSLASIWDKGLQPTRNIWSLFKAAQAASEPWQKSCGKYAVFQKNKQTKKTNQKLTLYLNFSKMV